MGVGAIIDGPTPRARRLDADVVLVANGGIGSAFDELEMNRAKEGCETGRVISQQGPARQGRAGPGLRRTGHPGAVGVPCCVAGLILPG